MKSRYFNITWITTDGSPSSSQFWSDDLAAALAAARERVKRPVNSWDRQVAYVFVFDTYTGKRLDFAVSPDRSMMEVL